MTEEISIWSERKMSFRQRTYLFVFLPAFF